MCKYSIVVPAYNEEKSLQLFYDAVTPMMESTGETFEIIFVNDGSRDETKNIINALADKDNRVKGCHFSRKNGNKGTTWYTANVVNVREKRCLSALQHISIIA